jgi:TRAP-type C4-dicarboxylate transport system permease large subunit
MRKVWSTARAAGGTLGIIIPPSALMILYGIATETSIVDLFRAGIGPGLLLALVFALQALLWFNRRMPSVPFRAAELARALREGAWAVALPVASTPASSRSPRRRRWRSPTRWRSRRGCIAT